MKPNLKQISMIMSGKRKVHNELKLQQRQEFLDRTNSKSKEIQKTIDKKRELQKLQQRSKKNLLY